MVRLVTIKFRSAKIEAQMVAKKRVFRYVGFGINGVRPQMPKVFAALVGQAL